MAGQAAQLFVSVDARIGALERGLAAADARLLRTAGIARKSTASIAADMAAAGKRTQAIGRTMTRTMTLPIIGGFALIGKATIGFDKAMRNVNSIAQLSEGRFKKLSGEVLKLSGKTAQAPKTLAGGLYDLVSSGFNAQQSMKILESSAKAATAGLTTTEVSTKAVAAVLNAYSMPASKAAHVSDVLFRTVDKGVLTFEALAQNIGDVLPWGRSLGVTIEELGAAVATMTQKGESAPEAMTKLKGSMVALMKPSTEMKAAYQELGVASGEELVQKTGSLQGALQALARTTGENKEAFQKLFPDIRGSAGAMQLTGKNAGDAARHLRALRDSAGATAKALKEQSKSAAFGWQKVKAEAAAAAIQLGQVVVPAMTAALSKVAGLARAFSELPRSTQNLAVGFAAALASVGPLTYAFGKLVQLQAGVMRLFAALRVGATVAGGLYAIGGGAAVAKFALGGLAVAARANPLIALLTAVAVGAGAIKALGGSFSSAAVSAREFSSAMTSAKAALDGLRGAQLGVEAARASTKQAAVQEAMAEREVTRLRRDGKRGTLEYKAALANLAAARVAYKMALLAERDAERAISPARKKAIEETRKGMETARARTFTLLQEAVAQKRTGAELESYRKRLVTTRDATRALIREARKQGISKSDPALRAAIQDAKALDTILAGLDKRRPRPKVDLNAGPAQARAALLIGLLTKVGAMRPQPTITANVGQAVSAIGTVLGLLSSVRSKSVVISVATIVSRIFAGGGKGPKARGSRNLRGSKAEAPFLFEDERDIARAEQNVESFDAAVERADRIREGRRLAAERRKALHRVAGLERLKPTKDRKDKLKQARDELKQAREGLRDFTREADRARRRAVLQLRVTGLERIRRTKNALKDLRQELTGKMQDATEKFRDWWENNVGRTIDKANKKILRDYDKDTEKKLDAFDAETEAAIRNTSEFQELEKLKSEERAAGMREEDERLRKQLADAEASGDVEQIAAAKEEMARVSRARRMEELEAKLAEREDEIRRKRAEDRVTLEEGFADQRLELEEKLEKDKEALYTKDSKAFEDHLKTNFDNLVAWLGANLNEYARFVKSVRDLLATIGIDYEGSPEIEAALRPPQPARRKLPAGKRKKAKDAGAGLGSISNRAHGGYSIEDFTVVGEAGPELVSLPRGSYVHTASQTDRLIAALEGRGGGVFAPITIQGTTDPHTVATLAARKLAWKLATA